MSKWKDIATVTVPKAAYANQAFNTERFDNIISRRFFYSETYRVSTAEVLNGLFNKSAFAYPADQTALGLPTTGPIFDLSYSNYADAPNTAVGINFMISGSGELFYRRVANASNGGDGNWKKVATT